MSSPQSVIVVGAGIAGLTAARLLHHAGFPVRVFEAEPEIGGRTRSHRSPDGFIIDRGFQILLSAYPALQRHADLDALGARPFASGAHVWTGARLVPLRNPLRHPWGIVRDLTSPVLDTGDRLRLVRAAFELARAPWTTAAEAADVAPDASALDALHAHGFSEAFVDRFARPFWGGIALDPSLSFSAGVMRFTSKMFLAGDAVLLREGAGTLPRAVAAGLPASTIATSTPVESLVVENGRVTGVRVGGETVPAAAVVVAADPPAAARLTGIDTLPTEPVGCVTVYLATEQDPGIGTMLVVDGTGRQPVNHVAPLSAVQPGYAPAGQHLLAAVLLGDESLARDDRANGEIAARSVATMLGIARPGVVEVVRVPFSLYRQPPGIHRVLPDATTGVPGVFLAGDATVDASVNGAIMSGEDAAHAVRIAIGDTGTATIARREGTGDAW
jgi:phytoene dehydrogenase-like protein